MTRQQVDPNAARASAVALDLRVLMGELRRRLRETGHAGDLTWSQTSVLAHLESEGPATVTTLARAQGVRPQSMGANVAVLEAAGLISGAPDPTDGRQTILSLTAAAREEIKSGRTAKEDWLARPCPIARADHPRWCPARRYARPHCQSIRHRCRVRRRRHHIVIGNVITVSLRQRITPARLLGSVNSGSASLVGAPCRSGPPLGVYSHSFSDSGPCSPSWRC